MRDDVQFRVLRLLSENVAASQREMSNSIGVSLGLVNSCLKVLIAKKLVVVSNIRTDDQKLRYTYSLTSEGHSEKLSLSRHFLLRKLKEFEALQAEIEALRQETAHSEHF